MIEIIKKGPNRVDLKLSGKIDADHMTRALNEIEEKCRDIENGVMMYDVIDFHMPSLQAIGIELSRLPSMFGIIKKFRKAAVITDKDGIKKVSEFEGMLIPNLEIKGFDLGKRAEAEAWLTD